MIPFLQNYFKTAEAHPDRIAVVDREGIAHGRASYWIEKGDYDGHDLTCLLFQGDTYEYSGDLSVIESAEALPAGGAACNNTLDVEILDGRNDFGVLLDYNARKYDRSSMERFADIFCSICESLVRNERENTFLSQNPHFQFTNSR